MKKISSILLFLITFSTIFILGAEAKIYSSYNAPRDVHINSVHDLSFFARDFNRGRVDRDCNVFLDSDILIDEYIEPIGTVENPFCGSFMGYSKKVELNLDAESSSYALFGYTQNALIKDVFIHGSMMVSRGAGVVLFAENTGIYGCENKAIINAFSSEASGIALFAKDCVICDCKNHSAICSVENAGGIVCVSDNTTISCCENWGQLSCNYGFLAGIAAIAKNNTKVNECVNKGDLSFFDQVFARKHAFLPMSNFSLEIKAAKASYMRHNFFTTKKFLIARDLVGLCVGRDVIVEQGNDEIFCVGLTNAVRRASF